MKIKNIIALIFLAQATMVQAQDIESIVVVGSVKRYEVPDPVIDLTLIEKLQPESVFNAGNIGGFSGFTERGTQVIHTTVYRNGMPVNDAGSGWYDFGHDFSTGNEYVTIVDGANSVLYGSGSLGGTVFINDMLHESMLVRMGNDQLMLSNTFDDLLNVSYIRANNGSVRTDNTEVDYYENLSGRTVFDIDKFTVSANLSAYRYDFDQCWTNQFLYTNDCQQDGLRGTITVRDDSNTFGYSFNRASFYSENDKTWNSNAHRFYFDKRERIVNNSNQYTILGITVNDEHYAGSNQTLVDVYGVINFKDRFSIGARANKSGLSTRVGFTKDLFYANAGTSFRNPTLYELHGDAFVLSNNSLKQEKAIGFDIGYGPLGFYRYEFSEGIDYDFSNNQFINTGKYTAQGVRFQDSFSIPYGVISIVLGYTDTTQPRAPKYKTRLDYNVFYSDYKLTASYSGMFDRGNEFTGEQLKDINTVDLAISKFIDSRSRLKVSFTIQDLLNKRFEFVPGYSAGGRNFFLTMQYN